MKNGDILLLRMFNQQFREEDVYAYELQDGVLRHVGSVPQGYFKDGILGYTRIIRFQDDDGVSGWYTRTNVQSE